MMGAVIIRRGNGAEDTLAILLGWFVEVSLFGAKVGEKSYTPGVLDCLLATCCLWSTTSRRIAIWFKLFQEQEAV
jgi:hypothetical protein